jgi:cardiolipin synthase
MSVDGLWALVGSANWDVRSFRLNFELDIEIYHSAVVHQVDELITAHQGTQISASALNGRPLVFRLRDGAARLLVPYL